MGELSAEDESHVRETIGIILEHGPIGLAGALAQWLTAHQGPCRPISVYAKAHQRFTPVEAKRS
jgi:hypothetical protein